MDPSIMTDFISKHKIVLSDKSIKQSMQNYFLINKYRKTYNVTSNVIKAIYEICDLNSVKWLSMLFSIKYIENLEFTWSLAFEYCLYDNKRANLAKWLYDYLFKKKSGYFNYIEKEPDKDCTICYDTAEIKTHCGHYYCKECFFEWYKKNKNCTTCPMCRTKIKLNKCNIIQK